MCGEWRGGRTNLLQHVARVQLRTLLGCGRGAQVREEELHAVTVAHDGHSVRLDDAAHTHTHVRARDIEDGGIEVELSAER